MQYNIPTTDMIQRRLNKLNQAQLHQLADDTGVPYSTLVKIKYAETKNPGIETVRRFFPVLLAMTDVELDQQQDD